MNLWEVKNTYETLTRVNCRKDGKCYEEDEENVETLRIAFLENHPIGWTGFDTTWSHTLFLFLPLNALFVITVEPLNKRNWKNKKLFEFNAIGYDVLNEDVRLEARRRKSQNRPVEWIERRWNSKWLRYEHWGPVLKRWRLWLL